MIITITLSRRKEYSLKEMTELIDQLNEVLPDRIQSVSYSLKAFTTSAY